jgi:hypothetical protein
LDLDTRAVEHGTPDGDAAAADFATTRVIGFSTNGWSSMLGTMTSSVAGLICLTTFNCGPNRATSMSVLVNHWLLAERHEMVVRGSRRSSPDSFVISILRFRAASGSATDRSERVEQECGLI